MKTKCLLLVSLLSIGFLFNATAQNPKKYAVIITGDSPGDGYQGQFANPNSDYDEFWNDTYLMWEMLVTKFGFDDSKVFVLYAGGQDQNIANPTIASRYTVSNANNLMGWNLPKITDYPASLTNVQNVLGGLQSGSNGMPQVLGDDFLFVFTFGHGHFTSLSGTPPFNGVLELLGDDVITVTELSGLINNIPANKRLIWMQNCTGGDFAAEFSNNNNYFIAATMPYPTGGLANPADNLFFGTGD